MTMMTHATKVVSEPKIISNGPNDEARLANKQPNVKPTVKLGLKKTNKFRSSENLNCMNSYESGPQAIVITAYTAAIMPLRAIFLTLKYFSLIKFDPIPS